MLLILDPEVGPETLESVLREVRALGWTAEISRGEEQVVVALEGTGDAAELEKALARHEAVDVVPLLSAKEWSRLRARRRFMAGTATGLGVLTAIGLGIPVIGFLMPVRGVVSDRVLQRAAKAGELEEFSAKRLELLGKPVFLVRLDGERYFALSAICTHMNICRLEWHEDRRQLVCPCHGGAFDVYGNVVQGPPSIPLPTWPVEQVGAEVYIRRLG